MTRDLWTSSLLPLSFIPTQTSSFKYHLHADNSWIYISRSHALHELTCLSICFDHVLRLSDQHKKFNLHQLSCLLTSPPQRNQTKNCCSFSVHQFEQTLDVALILDSSFSLTSLTSSHQQNIWNAEPVKRHTASGATSLLQAPISSCLVSSSLIVPLSLWFLCFLLFTPF